MIEQKVDSNRIDLRPKGSGFELPGSKIKTHEAEGLSPKAAASNCQYPITYEAAYLALNTATWVHEVNNILHVAAAVKIFARNCNDRSIELDAIELGFLAECRLDDLTSDQVDEGCRLFAAKSQNMHLHRPRVRSRLRTK